MEQKPTPKTPLHPAKEPDRTQPTDKDLKAEFDKELKQNIDAKAGKGTPTFYELGEGSEPIPPTDTEVQASIQKESGQPLKGTLHRPESKEPDGVKPGVKIGS